MSDGRVGEPPEPTDDVDFSTPISFKVMVVLAAAYLLYRLGQGVVWLFQALGG